MYMKLPNNDASNLVTFAHLLQSSRGHDNYTKATKQITSRASGSRFIEVDSMPHEAPRWKERARNVLEMSRGARDLTEQDEAF
eukprot:65385-Pyramimonas_sp.AAC.1